MVYARRDGKGDELRLGVSDMLWRDGLVMFDRDSRTLWAQVTGEGLVGPKRGQKLQPISSVRTTWAEWVKAHPDTKVLSKQGQIIRSSRYAGYERDRDKLGVLGTHNPDRRLPGKEKIVGVSSGIHATAVRRSELAERRLVPATVGEAPVIFVWRGEGHGSAVFGTRLDDRALRLEQGLNGALRDLETGTTWDPMTGEAVEGPLKGQRLVPLPSLEAYWFAWAAYHPSTAVVGGLSLAGAKPKKE